MAFQIRLARHQVADLKRIVALGSERLGQVRERLAKLSDVVPAPSKLLAVVGAGIEASDAEALIRQLLSLRGLIRHSGEPIASMVEGLGEALTEDGGEPPIHPSDWRLVGEQLNSLLALDCIRLATTAIELSYDYANLLQRAKILTDIRPLFDDSAEHICGAVVSFTMRLRYTNADGEHDLSIALDERDIRLLATQCDRAITKANTARTLLSERCEVPVAVFGGAEDG